VALKGLPETLPVKYVFALESTAMAAVLRPAAVKANRGRFSAQRAFAKSVRNRNRAEMPQVL
jgi:hypothetical protein